MKIFLGFLFYLSAISCSDITEPEIIILKPSHESVYTRGSLNFTKPIILEYNIYPASSCASPSIYLDHGPLVFYGIPGQSYATDNRLEIDFALFAEGHHELRIVLSCTERDYETAVVFEVLHLRHPFDALNDSLEACLLNASASPYPFMHIFHGSWTATATDPPHNFEDGDLILDIGANIGEQTMRLAAAHPRSRIHAYEILPVPAPAGPVRRPVAEGEHAAHPCRRAPCHRPSLSTRGAPRLAPPAQTLPMRTKSRSARRPPLFTPAAAPQDLAASLRLRAWRAGFGRRVTVHPYGLGGGGDAPAGGGDTRLAFDVRGPHGEATTRRPAPCPHGAARGAGGGGGENGEDGVGDRVRCVEAWVRSAGRELARLMGRAEREEEEGRAGGEKEDERRAGWTGKRVHVHINCEGCEFGVVEDWVRHEQVCVYVCACVCERERLRERERVRERGRGD